MAYSIEDLEGGARWHYGHSEFFPERPAALRKSAREWREENPRQRVPAKTVRKAGPFGDQFWRLKKAVKLPVPVIIGCQNFYTLDSIKQWVEAKKTMGSSFRQVRGNWMKLRLGNCIRMSAWISERQCAVNRQGLSPKKKTAGKTRLFRMQELSWAAIGSVAEKNDVRHCPPVYFTYLLVIMMQLFMSTNLTVQNTVISSWTSCT